MIRRLALGTLAAFGMSLSLAASALAFTTVDGQVWDYEPDAWTRGNNADTSYFGWDRFEASSQVLGFLRVIDDSTPDLGAVGSPAQRIYQGINGIGATGSNTTGHRSGTNNYYSFNDNADDTITGTAPASGVGGFTTVVLQVLGAVNNELDDLSFAMTSGSWTQQKSLFGILEGGDRVYWQEWTSAGADLPFAIHMTSATPHRSITAIQVDTFWSTTETINAISAIGVPEPSAGLLAATGIVAMVARRRRK